VLAVLLPSNLFVDCVSQEVVILPFGASVDKSWSPVFVQLVFASLVSIAVV
jgi:hypothetical protein